MLNQLKKLLLFILLYKENMKQLIYWSTAIKHWYSDFKRTPNDLDIITELPIKITWAETYCIPEFELLFKHNKDSKYVDPEFLYIIKLSHLAYNINWDKHMKDFIFLKSKKLNLATYHLEFYKEISKAWERIHWTKKVKLNISNEDFFKKNIIRKYDHDWLHKQFAFYDTPLNEFIRKDLSSPLCSKELFDNLSYYDQILLAVEELLVLTCERYIFIDKPLPFQIAKTKMLKQMITSSTSWWFNQFLILNFLKIKDFKIPEDKLLLIKKLWLNE